MRIYSIQLTRILIFSIIFVPAISCKKLVTVDEPIDSITAEKMYKNEPQAESALVGIYNSMVHGPRYATGSTPSTSYQRGFAAGLATYAGGLSAGEFNTGSITAPVIGLATNRLTLQNNAFTDNFWNSAYNVIYIANSVIEGLASAEGGAIRDSVKSQYTAEAKFLRAFAYFYLVNFFGDVPLALTVDFHQTIRVSRSPVTAVYAQILKDLGDAERGLPASYPAGVGSRVRVKKWAAKAMLAKVHLYMGNDAQAAIKATELIDQAGLFQLEPLNNAFLKDSKEAIFQLMQSNQDNDLKNATSEGWFFIPAVPFTGIATTWLSPELLQAFEPGDQRREVWTDSTLQTQNGPNVKVWYPTKYKTGRHNSVAGQAPNEYYMVLRLAEMYLIRAEARANGADGGHAKAIEDLNAIRGRTGLQSLPLNMDAAAVKEAVVQERTIELFAEWGNRWMDLKRTGKASAVLSAMVVKQPWEGDYQLLYPIPPKEIETNRNIVQNPGYIR